MNIAICSPSKGRAESFLTRAYLPFVKAYVPASEVGAYENANPGMEVVACPSPSNLPKDRNFILDTEFGNGADVVVMVDDDMEGMFAWEGRVRRRIEHDEFLGFIEKGTILARDWGAYLWGVNVNNDKQVYREYTPFSTTSYVSASFSVFLKGNELRYDERLPLKEDYDMTIQQANRYRVVLRFNKYFYLCKQSEQPGGCAIVRNYETEKRQLALLQKKWGSKIVKADKNVRNHLTTKARSQVLDYNPVITIPIPGV